MLVEEDSGEGDLQKWVGKDFYNPFIRDFIELEQPFKGVAYIHVHTVCVYTSVRMYILYMYMYVYEAMPIKWQH